MTVYFVDIDNTICITIGNDYKNAKPIYDRIEKLNQLYDSGHEIHYWTARGSSTGIDHSILTKAQLNMWDCKYTSVKTGKPAYDYWIDDKAINDGDFFN